MPEQEDVEPAAFKLGNVLRRNREDLEDWAEQVEAEIEPLYTGSALASRLDHPDVDAIQPPEITPVQNPDEEDVKLVITKAFKAGIESERERLRQEIKAVEA